MFYEGIEFGSKRWLIDADDRLEGAGAPRRQKESEVFCTYIERKSNSLGVDA